MAKPTHPGELRFKTRYTNVEILAFHHAVLRYANTATALALNCPAHLIEAYSQAISELQGLIHHDKKSQYSELIALEASKRTNILSTIFTLIEAYTMSPMPEMNEAGAVLKEATRLYRKTPQSALAAGTVEIKGLLKLLERDDLQTSIDHIAHLRMLIEHLRTSNTHVEEAMRARSAEEKQKSLGLEKRAAAYTYYQDIMQRAQASMFVAPSEAVANFATEVNNTIARTENVYKQRMGVKNAQEECD